MPSWVPPGMWLLRNAETPSSRGHLGAATHLWGLCPQGKQPTAHQPDCGPFRSGERCLGFIIFGSHLTHLAPQRAAAATPL